MRDRPGDADRSASLSATGDGVERLRESVRMPPRIRYSQRVGARRLVVLTRNLAATRTTPWTWPGSVRIAREAIRRRAWQKVGELAPLLALLRALQPRRALEIGTAHGGTLYAWARIAAEDAKLISIDLPGGAFGGGYTEEMRQRIVSYVLPKQTLELYASDSHQPETRDLAAAALGGQPADFLFIDGDHTYQGVRQDFEMYAPLVRRGGIVAFHDVMPNPTLPADQVGEVHMFWPELKREFRHLEILDTVDDQGKGGRWGGIGVVYT